MKPLNILLVFTIAVLLSGFSGDSHSTKSGVTVPFKFDGVIITNPSPEVICTPIPGEGDEFPLIKHSRFGWVQGHQTHGGRLITEQSTWEISSCYSDFATMLNYSQIDGVNTVANGDSYTYSCTMTTDLSARTVTLDITVTGGTGRFEGATGRVVLSGVYTESGIPVSGQGYIIFRK